jgi:hypothetical protein
MDRGMDGRVYERVDGRKLGLSVAETMDGGVSRRMDRWEKRWTDGRMDLWWNV